MSTNVLIVDLRDLPAQAGASINKNFEWVVPDGWTSEVVSLDEGTKVPIEVSMTAIEDGVLVKVSANGNLSAECVRCLDPIKIPWNVDSTDVYFESDAQAVTKSSDEEDGYEYEGDELDSARIIEKDQIDIEPLLRDSIFAEVPFQPVCEENCLGLCGQCGVRLKYASPEHHHDFFDPRFAALQDFFDNKQTEKE